MDQTLNSEGGGAHSEWAWATEDVGDANNPLMTFAVLRLDNINVSTFANLQVTVELASIWATPGGLQPDTYETDDMIEIQYAFDGNSGGIAGPVATLAAGTYATIGRFVGTGISDQGPRADVNLDGVADGGGAELDNNLTSYTFNVPGTGSTLSIQIRMSETGGSEEFVFDNIRVTGSVPVGDPPALANIEGAAASYTEGGPTTQVTNTLTATDTDSNIESARIQILTGNQPGEDVLSVVGALPAGITAAAYVPGTGIFALSGSATPAAYQTALRQIHYSNSSVNPNVYVTRVIEFQVNDGDTDSNIESRSLNLTAVVAASTIPYCEDFNTDGDGVRYTSNSHNDGGGDYFERTDANPHPGQAGTYTFNLPQQGGGYWVSEDVENTDNPLGATAPGIVRLPDLNSSGLANLSVTAHLAMNVTGTQFEGSEAIEVQVAFDGNTGGTDLLAGTYQTVGRFIENGTGVLQQDTDLDGTANGGAPTLSSTFSEQTFPITGTGSTLSVQILVLDTEGNEVLAFDSVKVNGESVGDPPVLANIEGTVLNFTEGDPLTQVSGTITATDADDVNLESALIEITVGYNSAEDILGVVGVLPAGITATPFNPGTGQLILTGTASVASYQTALRQIGYQNTATPNPDQFVSRTVVYQVSDGVSNSNFQSRVISVIEVVPQASMPYCETFDTDGEGSRYTSNTFLVGADYFERTDANPHPEHSVAYIFSAPQGAGYWASEDVDDADNPLGVGQPGINRIADLDVSGLIDLAVTIHLAENGVGLLEDTETIEVQVAFDGNVGGTDLTAGTYTTIGRFIQSGGAMLQDTDLDGSGDGAALTTTFTPYTFNISGVGNILSVQVLVLNTAGTEEMAFDHLKVDGNPALALDCPTDPAPIEGCDATDVQPTSSLPFNTTETATDSATFVSIEGGSFSSDGSLVSITYQDASSGLCPVTVTRTYRLIDDLGGTATCTQTFTIVDTQPPTIGCPSDITVEGCDADDVDSDGQTTLGYSPSFALITSNQFTNDEGGSWSDNCPPQQMIRYSDVSSGTCPVTVTRTFEITDRCGLTATCSQTIVIEDTVPPTITCPENVTIECGDPTEPDMQGPPGFATANDDCDVSPVIDWTDASDTDVNCPTVEVITRSWTAMDDCGNSVTCTQKITIVDTTAPLLDCPAELSVSVDGNCEYQMADFTGQTAVLDCSNTTLTQDPAIGTTVAPGPLVVTMTAVDDCGNAASCTFTLVVEDTTPAQVTCPGNLVVEWPAGFNTQPVPPNVPQDLSVDPTVTGSPNVIDNCPSMVFFQDALQGPFLPCGQQGAVLWTLTRAWTIILQDEQPATCIQIIDFIDTTPPTITCPDDVTIECSDPIPQPQPPILSDNCDPDVQWSSTDSAPMGTCPQIITRTYTAVDDCGNVAICSMLIYLEDTTAPVISKPADATIECGDPLPPAIFSATDNCSTAGTDASATFL